MKQKRATMNLPIGSSLNFYGESISSGMRSVIENAYFHFLALKETILPPVFTLRDSANGAKAIRRLRLLMPA